MVKYLLGKGAAINAKNHAGQTALDIAKAEKHRKIIKILKEN